jgi:hypothetical protein
MFKTGKIICIDIYGEVNHKNDIIIFTKMCKVVGSFTENSFLHKCLKVHVVKYIGRRLMWSGLVRWGAGLVNEKGIWLMFSFVITYGPFIHSDHIKWHLPYCAIKSSHSMNYHWKLIRQININNVYWIMWKKCRL